VKGLTRDVVSITEGSALESTKERRSGESLCDRRVDAETIPPKDVPNSPTSRNDGSRSITRRTVATALRTLLASVRFPSDGAKCGSSSETG
jgi:hypothetical protein